MVIAASETARPSQTLAMISSLVTVRLRSVIKEEQEVKDLRFEQNALIALSDFPPRRVKLTICEAELHPESPGGC